MTRDLWHGPFLGALPATGYRYRTPFKSTCRPKEVCLRGGLKTCISGGWAESKVYRGNFFFCFCWTTFCLLGWNVSGGASWWSTPASALSASTRAISDLLQSPRASHEWTERELERRRHRIWRNGELVEF